MSVLAEAHFHYEAAAYAWVEARVWPDGPICPRCNQGDRVGELKGKSTRIGVRKCYRCRKPFTVKVGTIFEDSHLPMHLWVQAIHLLCSSKKGISTQQLHRTLKVTLRTAWHLSHRIREAMRTKSLAPMGGPGSVYEIDETFIGKKEGAVKHSNARGYAHKQVALSLVERGGEVRSFVIDKASASDITPIVNANLDKEGMLMTDEASYYGKLGQEFEGHFTVTHGAGEYVRGDVHTNTLESYFSVFKRGMRGTYQDCAEKHLHRYLAEFDFRYNSRVALGVSDEQRAEKALQVVKG